MNLHKFLLCLSICCDRDALTLPELEKQALLRRQILLNYLYDGRNSEIQFEAQLAQEPQQILVHNRHNSSIYDDC